jgi:uncharacterized protein (TIGR00369 family)
VNAPALDARGVTEFLEKIWPGVTSWLTIEEVTHRGARVRMAASPERLRPGGIVSGPVLMSLADTAVWAAVLGVIGPVVMTVTADLTIHVLRPAPPADVIGVAHLHKVGRRLAVGDVLIYSDGDPEPVANATVTYAIPAAVGVPPA